MPEPVRRRTLSAGSLARRFSLRVPVGVVGWNRDPRARRKPWSPLVAWVAAA